MLDAPFATLEADYLAASSGAISHSAPASASGPLAAVAVALLRAYKLLISPLFTGSCRFEPSCADYMREAIIAHGRRPRRLARPAAARAVSSLRRPRLRSGAGPSSPPSVESSWNAGFFSQSSSRGRAVRLPGVLRAAADAAKRHRTTAAGDRSVCAGTDHRPRSPRDPAAPTMAAARGAAAAAVVGDSQRARNRRRHRRRRRRCFTNRGGRAAALAAEALPRRSRAARSISCRRRSPAASPRRSRCRSSDAAADRAVEQRAVPSRRRRRPRRCDARRTRWSFEYQDAAGVHVRKEFVFEPQRLHRHVLGRRATQRRRAI